MAVYTGVFTRISVGTAVQDLFELNIPSTALGVILSLTVTPTADEVNEQISIDLMHFSGAFTSGSGGSTVTAKATNGKFATASATLERNNTTQATGGTSIAVHSDGFALQGGWIYMPVPEERIWFGPSTAAVLRIGATLGQATAMSASIKWGEVLA
jgi:hypothetical protein